MQSICGEILFIFQDRLLVCFRMVGNDSVPAVSWREAPVCFIDLVHFCDMFSMYLLFSYKTCLQKVLPVVLPQPPGEQSPKDKFVICK